MKRYYIACLLIFINITIFAQNLQPEINNESEIVFTAGYNWHSLFTDIIDTANEYVHYYDSYIVSFFYLKNLGKILSLGVAVSNTYTKFETKSAFGYKFYDLRYNINYLNFLTLFHFNILTRGKINISLDIGPYISYIIYSSERGDMVKRLPIMTKNSSDNYSMNSKISQYHINQSPIKDLNKFFGGWRLGYKIEYFFKPDLSFLFANDFYYSDISNLNITCNCNDKWRSIDFSIGLIYKFNKEKTN